MLAGPKSYSWLVAKPGHIQADWLSSPCSYLLYDIGPEMWPGAKQHGVTALSCFDLDWNLKAYPSDKPERISLQPADDTWKRL